MIDADDNHPVESVATMSPERIDVMLKLVAEARRIWGDKEAKEIWQQLPFPQPVHVPAPKIRRDRDIKPDAIIRFIAQQGGKARLRELVRKFAHRLPDLAPVLNRMVDDGLLTYNVTKPARGGPMSHWYSLPSPAQAEA